MSAGDSGDVVLKGLFSIWPQQSTIKGGVRLKVSLPSSPPKVNSLHLLFSTDTVDTVSSTTDTGDTIPNTSDTADTAPNTSETADTTPNHIMRDTADTVLNTADTALNTCDTADAVTDTSNVVALIRDGTQHNVYYAMAPCRGTSGKVRVSIRCIDSSGHPSILHTTTFTYTLHDIHGITDWVLRHIDEGLPLQSDVIPSLEDTLELDRVLSEAVQGLKVPLDWRRLLGGREKRREIRARAPQYTLLHLASRHNLMLLARHLITLPHVDLALSLPDEQGLTPVDIAKDTGNKEMLKVLTCALLQSSVTGGHLTSGEPSSHRRTSHDELLRFREINEEWRGQIRRQKISSSSMGSSNFNPVVTAVSPRDRLPTPPFPQNPPSSSSTSNSPHCRKSIAVMEQRRPVASGFLQINTRDPKLAKSERHRKQSWSVVVGDADCRSMDTGLNELDRVIGTDRVQQCMTAVQGQLYASQEGEEREDVRANQLDPAHLGLLYCHSVSCPVLGDDDCSGSNSLLASTHTSPGPYDSSDSPPPLRLHPPSLTTSISVPDDLSEAGLHLHVHRPAVAARPPEAYSNGACPPSVSVPQLITTRYSTEDLLEVHVRNESTPGNERGSPLKESVSVLSTANHNKEEDVEDEEEDEEGEEREGDLCQSVSAPHLGVEDEQEGEERGSSCWRHTGEGAKESERDKNPAVLRKAKREVVFGNGHDILESNTSIEGSSVDQPTMFRSDSTPSKHNRKKSHRRSQSMSVVELGVPTMEKMEKCDEEEESSAKVLRRNRGSSSLKPSRLPVVESDYSLDQHSNESASRSNSIKDNRSRASSLLTDISSMHESGESMSDDDTMPELSGLSCASQEGADAQDDGPSTTTPIVNETEQQHLQPPGDFPDGAAVVLRGRKGQPRASQELRYSAEILSAYKDKLESIGDAGMRRLNSESIDKRKGGPFGNGDVEPEKTRPVGDSVFEQEVATLSDVDVRLQSDDNLSQDKPSPRSSPVLKEIKKRTYRSPLLGRRAHTVKEKTPPALKKKLMRGLTKDDVSPLIGKMRSILNSHEVSDDDEMVSSPLVHSQNSSNQLQSKEQQPATAEAATSPGGGSTNLDRLPRSPISSSVSPTSTSPTKNHTSTLSNKPAPSSPLSSGSQHRHTSPTATDPPGSNKGTIHKSGPDKVVSSLPPRGARKSKMKSMSVDESASSVKDIMSVRNAIAEPLQEENSEEGEELDQKPEAAGKKEESKTRMIRDTIFRRSKYRQKALTILGAGGSDSSLVHSPTNTTMDHSLAAVSELSQHPVLSPPGDPNSLSPGPTENLSDSDREEVPHQLVRSMSESHPELEIKEERNWERTMDRRLLRKMNKHERDRQNIIHEMIQTERHHYRVLHVLKLVFKEQMEKYLSDESLAIMFPELDNLIETSKSFLDRLEERRGKEGANVIIHDVSDILLEEFTGTNRERILNTFGEFCTYHLIATEMYKEQLKKKQFGRLVQQLYRIKECQRLYLPDYYTSVSQRLTKMVQFLSRLVKKTDILKLDHAERLSQCQRELETLVTAVDQHVDDRKNQLELKQIQDKLDITLPRATAKQPVLLAMKDLNFTAQNRRLLKRGDAQLIHGHGKQLPVHIVLVTDLVVLLTERDQKYNLPAILDLKPPIIRLYDLHVRVNASVRSGVQLLLLVKGSAPEMFRLDFKNKKEAKKWEVTLTNASDVCKEKGIKCEYYGSEPVVVEEEKGNVPEEVEISDETKQMLKEALEHGHIRTRRGVVFLVGVTGSGKTHFLHLVLDRPVPDGASTGLVEIPARLFIQVNKKSDEDGDYQDDDTWTEVSPNEMLQKLAGSIKTGINFLSKQQLEVSLDLKPENLVVSPSDYEDSEDQSSDTTEVSTDVAVKLDDKLGLGPEIEIGSSVPMPLIHAESSPGQRRDPEFSKAMAKLTINQTLLQKVSEKPATKEVVMEVDCLYISDTGGQLPFREMLPHFVHESTGLVLMQKLNERLDHKPLTGFRAEGNEVIGEAQSMLSNEEMLLQYIQAVQSHHACVFVVGSFSDEEHLCRTETRREKNDKLMRAFRGANHSLVHYQIAHPKELIFPVNSKSRDEKQKKTASRFRTAVRKNCLGKINDTPVPWFVLEQLLRQLAEILGRKVIRLEECYEVADRMLNISDCKKQCDAALEYFGKLNIFFYRPDILPDVIFCDSECILHNITQLVKCSHELREGSTSRVFQDPWWPEFMEKGLITPELLQCKEARLQFTDLFPVADFLKLLDGLLIAAKLEEGKYFMPSLLPDLPSENIVEYRVSSKDYSTPLAVHYGKTWLPVGVFPSLIVYLQNKSKWQLMQASCGEPACMHHNCMQFQLPGGKAGSVALIDSTKFLEIHVHLSLKAASKMCPLIRETIMSGLKEAHKSLHYDSAVAKEGLLCSGECGNKKTHLATLDEDRESWKCSEKASVGDDLDLRQAVWFIPQRHTAKGRVKLTLQQLQALHCCGGNVIRVMDTVAGRWRDLAIALSFDEAALDVFHSDSFGCSEKACFKMLQRWIRGGAAMPVCWGVLLQALRAGNFISLAHELSKAPIQLGD